MSIGKKLLFICLAWLCNSCGSTATSEEYSMEKGTIHISADETFKPVIDSQVQVFESSYPEAKVVVHYKPEAECLKDFAVDSIKMVIATRGYTENEEQFIFDSLHVSPSKLVIAKDAIAVIVHPGAPDSLFSMDEVKAVLLGTYPKKLLPVLDGVSATSTVRFIIDSVLKGTNLGSVVTAAKSSQEVVDYVAKTPNAVGFIGVSWIGNKEDSTQLSYLKKVKVAQIESTTDKEKFVSPAQYNIYYKRYPMVRDLVYVLKEKNRGVAHGFAYFMGGQRGQLIFKRSYLMPVLMGFNVRNASLRE
ncbi:MAG TPA: substrate-binding domain-containing protein [Chitinophagaceae bacterium]|nr:substrate-binding domain-containing protein [Chitinophagaceae bacterium]